MRGSHNSAFSFGVWTWAQKKWNKTTFGWWRQTGEREKERKKNTQRGKVNCITSVHLTLRSLSQNLTTQDCPKLLLQENHLVQSRSWCSAYWIVSVTKKMKKKIELAWSTRALFARVLSLFRSLSSPFLTLFSILFRLQKGSSVHSYYPLFVFLYIIQIIRCFILFIYPRSHSIFTRYTNVIYK